ncbi:MAG TPA: hypothetical protein VFQ38_18895 [Longimicrobiales bacterium]|nr:hypothetical protein [Longimicrobiales bacterium]
MTFRRKMLRAARSEPGGPGRRPFGLYAIITLLLANGALTALDVSRSYVSLGIDLGIPRPATIPGLSDADVDRLLRIVSAGGFVAVAIGIWMLRRWAWVALMIVVGLALGDGILRYVHGEPRYPSMWVNVLIVFYLNQRTVQRLFRRDRPPPTPA